MKSNRRNVLFLTSCLALVLSGFASLHAQTSRLNVPRVRFVAAITSSQFIVNGEVTERNETGFTVLSRTSELTTVLVTEDTAITKGAVTIKLTDLAVGDKVSVTAMRSADGKLVAVSVAVRVGNE
jgi:hypothetical protein